MTVVSSSSSETSSTTVSTRLSETSSRTGLNETSMRSSETSSTAVSANPNEVTSLTTVSANPNEVNTISDLLDELFGPAGIPDDILPNETLSNEDEGIELNHFDELTFDYEPFDFLSETEGF